MSAVKKTIEEELKSAMSPEVEEVEEIETDVEESVEVENTEEKASIAEKQTETTEPTEVKEDIKAPISLSGSIKEKWRDLPDDVKREWKKREDDVHRMMTAHDGELRLGREVREIATPYEAIIRAEGGTVAGAFKDLLNTAYVLRTGSPQQKAQLLLETARQFNVDLGNHTNTTQNSPVIALQEEIHRLKQQFNPEKIKNELQEEAQRGIVADEISKFAANPGNIHFEAVRTVMGSLMVNGQAKNLQDAYEQACWSDPSIRKQLLTAQAEEEKKKRRVEMEAKKKAALSVTGSLGLATPNNQVTKKSLEDELKESLRASRGESI
ncbi:MAG: hypothetical protein ACRC5T_11165 [Cetobacterium sp.]